MTAAKCLMPNKFLSHLSAIQVLFSLSALPINTSVLILFLLLVPFSGIIFKECDWTPSSMTFSSHAFPLKAKEREEKGWGSGGGWGGQREERLLIFKQRDRRRERGGVERERAGERQREKRERKRCCGIFSSPWLPAHTLRC